jgi:hypothetical protein
MEKIVTTAPIPIAVLKRKFTEDIHFAIDYANSKFKGKTLITYLSNLNIKCNLMLQDVEEALALTAEYLYIPAVASIPDLEDVVINLLLAYQGKQNWLNFDIDPFVAEHREIIELWIKRINSLPLFALHCSGLYKEHVDTFPKDDDKSIAGINFVQLIKHPLFPLLVANIDECDFSYNEMWFNEYVFAGSNLFSFFAVKENPLYLGLISQLAPDPEDREIDQILADTIAEYNAVMGESNVPLI